MNNSDPSETRAAVMESSSRKRTFSDATAGYQKLELDPTSAIKKMKIEKGRDEEGIDAEGKDVEYHPSQLYRKRFTESLEKIHAITPESTATQTSHDSLFQQ
ncbi:hypothetical protein KR018_006098 [Drosophila ironensis]|nr:hypothetical protein KR018_006098 [Drosophila ironensis]